MSLRQANLATAVLASALFGTSGCGSTSASDSRVGADAAPTSCAVGPFGPPVTHSATTSGACPPSLQGASFPDGGLPCSTDSDCAAGGGSGTSLTCLHGNCSANQCSVDSDCGATGKCACANGNPPNWNMCLPSECRIDSDCGPGGYCSPSFTASCNALAGYYCHKAADTCANDIDCQCASSQAGGRCYYEPSVSHWQCEAVVVCSG